MKTRKYIKIEKGSKGKEYINRFLYLLNLISKENHVLDTLNMMASLENTRTQMTVVTFSENPFKYGI